MKIHVLFSVSSVMEGAIVVVNYVVVPSIIPKLDED